MTAKEITQQIKSVTADRSISLNERIEMVFGMRTSEKWDRNIDIDCFKALIEAIITEDAVDTYLRELLQLYVLLAETYDELEIFRPLENLAYEVRGILEDGSVRWEIVNETIPRIIDVLSNTVYHHETYRMLLVYLDIAFKNGQLNEKFKGQVLNLLKLRILLEDNSGFDEIMTKEFQTTLASLFTPEELLKIILNPSLGYLKCDPVEYTYKWEEIFYDVEDYLNDLFADEPRHMGFCFRYWSAKHEYLKEKYNIDWRSPSRMNPRVMFD